VTKFSARREGTCGTEGAYSGYSLHPAGQLCGVSQAVDIGLIHFGDPEAVRAASVLNKSYSGFSHRGYCGYSHGGTLSTHNGLIHFGDPEPVHARCVGACCMGDGVRCGCVGAWCMLYMLLAVSCKRHAAAGTLGDPVCEYSEYRCVSTRSIPCV
jgi:hypothetical protein